MFRSSLLVAWWTLDAGMRIPAPSGCAGLAVVVVVVVVDMLEGREMARMEKYVLASAVRGIKGRSETSIEGCAWAL
jgi:hypothetical protein